MTGSLQDGLIFLIKTVIDLYLFVLIIRFLLAYTRADYFNPLTQLVVRLSNPIIVPVRKIIPNVHDIELSSLLLIYLINLLKFTLIGLMGGFMINISGLFLIALADVLHLFIQTLTVALILYVVMSWVQPFSPMQRILQQIVSPLVAPFQRLIPPVAGFDLSIIPAFIVLQLFSIVLVTPLMQWGLQLNS
jgi:YggT family protein